jgi:alpha-L-fucosidase
MHAIGRWLQVNGEAIYGTVAGPLQGLESVRTTQRGSTVYLHTFGDDPQTPPHTFRLVPLG